MSCNTPAIAHSLSASPAGSASSRRGSGETDEECAGEAPRKRRMKFSRSRGGCLTCRKQKKKCDQERPICQRCRATGKTCRYATPVERNPEAQQTPTPAEAGQDASASSELTSTTPSSSRTQSNLDFFSTVSLGQSSWTGVPEQPDSTPSSLSPLNTSSASNTASSFPRTYPAPASESSWPEPSTSYDTTQTLAVANTIDSGNDANFQIDDALLRAFFGTESFMPIPYVYPLPTGPMALEGTSESAQEDTAPSAALLSVPLDCDSALWSAFVESSLWNSRPVSVGEDGHLMEYFMRIAATTVVVRNAPNSASQFYSDSASSASSDRQSASSHGILCVSAQHLANWSRKAGDNKQAITFADQASRHKSKALHSSRVSTADKSKSRDASSPAVMVMSILGAISKGESDISPSFLQRTGKLLSKIERPSEHPFLPTVSAIHSVYTSFHSSAQGKQADIEKSFVSWDEKPVWQEKAEAVCESIAGVKKRMLSASLRVHSLVIESETISKALKHDPEDDESVMMKMESESEASILKTESSDDGLFEEKYRRGCSERTTSGHEMYRTAITASVIKGVFGLASGHPRLRKCVDDMLRSAESCTPGTEIGSVWPYIIVASEAGEDQQDGCSQFIRRCQWKGSAGPRSAEKIVEEVWGDRRQGKEGSWRGVVTALGSPLVV